MGFDSAGIRCSRWAALPACAATRALAPCWHRLAATRRSHGRRSTARGELARKGLLTRKRLTVTSYLFAANGGGGSSAGQPLPARAAGAAALQPRAPPAAAAAAAADTQLLPPQPLPVQDAQQAALPSLPDKQALQHGRHGRPGSAVPDAFLQWLLVSAILHAC